MKEKSTQPHYLTSICIRWLVLPVSDPAAVLEDGAVDGAVGGEPALHPLEVGVGDRRRGGAHHLKEIDSTFRRVEDMKPSDLSM